MNTDLDMLLSLRRVMESAGGGMGMSKAIITILRGMGAIGAESARLLLLGFPLAVSLKPLAERGSEEVAMLASLIISSPRSSTTVVGSSGEALADTLGRWVKARENGILEQKVLRFRGIITSGVLGGVTAMVASLGPIVGNLDFAAPSLSSAGSLLPAAGVMTLVSSAMVGLFMSGRGFYANVAVSLAVFLLVSALAAPLASIPSVSLWGVK